MTQNKARLAYREDAVRSANSVGLVIMLYDIAIEDIRDAIAAIQDKNTEKRTEAIKHVLLVVQQLQGSLNMERGGEAAISMDRFYSIVRARLLEAQIKVSEEVLHEQLSLFLSVKDAWRQSELSQGKNSQLVGTAPAPAIDVPVAAASKNSNLHWSA